MSDKSPIDIPENQQEPEISDTESESDESAPSRKEPYVDQEMADAYGFTPQQAKEMALYL